MSNCSYDMSLISEIYHYISEGYDFVPKLLPNFLLISYVIIPYEAR